MRANSVEAAQSGGEPFGNFGLNSAAAEALVLSLPKYSKHLDGGLSSSAGAYRSLPLVVKPEFP